MSVTVGIVLVKPHQLTTVNNTLKNTIRESHGTYVANYVDNNQ